jgi:hypothetical protein
MRRDILLDMDSDKRIAENVAMSSRTTGTSAHRGSFQAGFRLKGAVPEKLERVSA